MGAGINSSERKQLPSDVEIEVTKREPHGNRLTGTKRQGKNGSCQTTLNLPSTQWVLNLFEDIEDRMYTVSEVCQKYDMSHQYINSLVQRGLINPPKDGEYNNRSVYRLREKDVRLIAYMVFLQEQGYRPSEITDQILNGKSYLELIGEIFPSNHDAFHKAYISFKDAIHNLPSLDEKQKQLLKYRDQQKTWSELQEILDLSGNKVRKLLEETFKQIGLSFYNWTLASGNASWFWNNRYKHSLGVHYIFQELEQLINPNLDCTISMLVQEVVPHKSILSPWFVLKNRPVTKKAVKELESRFVLSSKPDKKPVGISGLVATFTHVSELSPELQVIEKFYDQEKGIYISDLHYVDERIFEYFINIDHEFARANNDRNIWSFPLQFGNKCFIVSLTASKPDHLRIEQFDEIVEAVEKMLLVCEIDTDSSLAGYLTKISDAAKKFDKSPQYINTLVEKDIVETEKVYDNELKTDIRHVTLSGMATLEIICKMQRIGYRMSEIKDYLKAYEYFQKRSHSLLRKNDVMFIGNKDKLQKFILRLPNLTPDHKAILGLRFGDMDWDTIYEKLNMTNVEGRRHLDNAYRELGRSLQSMLDVYTMQDVLDDE